VQTALPPLRPIMTVMKCQVRPRREKLCGLYLFGAVRLLLCCFGFIIAPKSMTMFNAAFMVPDFVAELLVGLWLAFKGANVPLQGD
jgi:hypothetical protein